MFKKKKNLPARPPIPNKDEILEDLNRVNSNDDVFKHMQENPAALTGEAVAASEKKENFEDPKHPFHQYYMITKYCEKMEKLKKYDEEIRNGRDGLQYLTKDLLEDMERAGQEVEILIAKKEAEI